MTIFSPLSRWVLHSLQRQLALGFCSVAIIMMLAMSGLLLHKQRTFLNNASNHRAAALANNLAQSSVSAVLAYDLVGLEEIVSGFAHIPNQERIFVLNTHGQVLASTITPEAGRFVNDAISLQLLQHAPEPHIVLANSTMIDAAAPIMVDKRLVGWARVELNQKETNANLTSLAATQLGFILMTSALMLAISGWLGHRMSARLLKLGRVTQLIANGERSVRAISGQADEIGHLANNVNQMLETLTQSERDLEQLNRIYAAWTECVATMARESLEPQLLNHLCEILVKNVGFRLAFIAFTDANGDWLEINASSNWQIEYLQKLKISARADRPEGQGPMGHAIRSGHPKILNDFLGNRDVALWHAAANSQSIRSVAAFPLSRGGKIVGGIAVYSDKLNYFSNDIIALLNGLSIDISFALDNIDLEIQRRQAETELRLAASVFENSQEGIMITDANRIVIRINPMFTTLTGYSEAETLGKPAQILASDLQDQTFYISLWQQITEHGIWEGEIFNRRKSGEVFVEWLSLTRVTADDNDDRITHYVGTFADITDRKLNEERIHRLAFYDPLTELPNRRLLVDRLRQALVESQRSQLYGAVLFMDLDRFKILNDTQGHDLGDQLLIEASKRISECVREQDTVARLGGDEFVVMLEQVGQDQATALAITKRIGDKLLNTLRQPYTLCRHNSEGHTLPIIHHSSASIGMTLFQGALINSDDLLKQADVAMYQAKHAGRNKLSAFNPEMQADIVERAALEAELRQAVINRQFSLHYQIQVDSNDRATGAEVLLRWQHPQRGMISPAEFIPLCEECGLIDELGLWVLNESCTTLQKWAQLPQTCQLTLSVNVSARQFNQSNFVSQIATLLNTRVIDPRLLKLEITESLIMDNVDEVIAIMQQLRALGLSFSMDDFGTGYSSLSYIQRLPLTQLKIDQSFVRDLANDSSDAAIIRTILALSHSLALDVVAEGVETEEQRDYLIANGCQYFQGYLFGKPVPLEAFEQQVSLR
jgi:diguanylate cyclase (GGDEF)-like protein/PAS domain S-box-containing protein